ncbi:hypothetical protein WR25_01959 [Diploscapter pachys]|uniref:Choline/carnitine acyltransferase domain-containing protein n=1 Tax=Diploscapter pachys TaxID=2018661 RepID=A0A2A2L174_9BILA|nr:hypothetical protein WR25_01959 [Diploscapter pachys]
MWTNRLIGTTAKHRHLYRLFSQMPASLPNLPVPDPKNTLSRFLDFSQAIQSKHEYAKTAQAVQEFVKNEMPRLQELLEKRAKTMNNWLTPWWLNAAYLAARTPLPIVTSPGVMFPKFEFTDQVDLAARIILSTLRFYDLVRTGTIEPDRMGKEELDMSQYAFMFGTTRIPKKGCDQIRYGIEHAPNAKHIVVLKKGHVFHVPVLDSSGNPISYDNLCDSLRKVVSMSEPRNEIPVGIGSAGARDKWATIYEKLKADSTNASNLQSVEDALFLVCIDEHTEPPTGYTPQDELCTMTLTGGGSKKNSLNRWFDKTVQYVISTNGYCGMTYEHTPAEGPPVARLMDYVCDQIHSKFDHSGSGAGDIKRLDFTLDDALKKRVRSSIEAFDLESGNVDVIAYTFKRFGKNLPKSVKLSPDSFIQMAFQLAFYRLHHTFPPTYETASLRRFAEGRTENIRSPNTAAAYFVKCMTEGDKPINEVYQAIRNACEQHKKYSVDCMSGRGMDRHLLAWRMLASENSLPTPSICATDAYQALQHFQVSTSQVPTKHFIQMCFGPSHPDCYGICYNPQEEQLHFTISTFKHNFSTSGRKFSKELEKALNDMITTGMSSVVNFVRRNKYKIIVGGIAVGGAVALAEKIWQSSEEANKYSNGHVKEEVNTNTALRNEARRHYVFDTNQRSCDESILTLAISLIALIKSKHDVDLLKDELKFLPNLTHENRLQLWDMIKHSTITRLIVTAYGYSLLIVTLKTQISLMARDICNQFETPKSSGW